MIIQPVSNLPDWARADPMIVHLVRYYGYSLHAAYEHVERVAIEELS